MSMNRLDGWTQEEEEILATIILSAIKNGGTQMSAFLEAGQKLKRTPTACGHRWNRVIRKKYADKIEDAKTAWKVSHSNFDEPLERELKAVPQMENMISDQQNATSVSPTSDYDLLLAEIGELRRVVQTEQTEQKRLSHDIEFLREELKTLATLLVKAQENARFFIQLLEVVCKEAICKRPFEDKN